METGTEVKLAAAFRQHLPDTSTPRFTTARSQTPYEYTATFQRTKFPPWIYALTETWQSLLKEPFHGISTDGEAICRRSPAP